MDISYDVWNLPGKGTGGENTNTRQVSRKTGDLRGLTYEEERREGNRERIGEGSKVWNRKSPS